MDRKYMLFPGFKKRCVTLSYDDGFVSDKKMVAVLDKYGIKCSFNLNSAVMPTEPDGSYNPRMCMAECEELFRNSPHEVLVHGAYHLNMVEITPDEVMKELSSDKQALESSFGTIRGMAYAYGTYNEVVFDVMRKLGLEFSRTTGDTLSFGIPEDWLVIAPTIHHTKSELSGVIDAFLDDTASDDPGLFFLWGHSWEFDRDNNWDVLEDFCKRVSARKDIWYATNTEVYDYVRAYDGLIVSSDGQTVTNPGKLAVYVNFGKGNIKIDAGGSLVL